MYIDGNIEIDGRVIENFDITATNELNVTYDAATWRTQISSDGEYVFSYTKPTSSVAAASWTAPGTWRYSAQVVQLSTYGLIVTNVVNPNINVNISGAGIQSATVVPSTFDSMLNVDGTYMFIFSNEATSWQLNGTNVTLSDYGLATTGTPQDGDTIYVNYITGTPDSLLTVDYTAPQQGTIIVATPEKFSATGFNQFDKNTMYLAQASISGGYIIQNSTTNVCYCRAKGGVTNGYVAYSSGKYIVDIGWCADVPTIGAPVVMTGKSVTNELASIPFDEDGYVVVVVSSMTDLCIHPKWSGSADTTYAAYVAPSEITIPTTDVNLQNLPTAVYGMPRVGGVADRLNLESGTYIQNIGRMENTTAAMEYIIGLGVAYEYDEDYIYYVLPTPVVYTVDVDPMYIVNDWGTEEFTGTTVGLSAQTLYGQNLRDKLRTDVLTISAQMPALDLSQKKQVLANQGWTPTTSGGNYMTRTDGIRIDNSAIAMDSAGTTLKNSILHFSSTLNSSSVTVSDSRIKSNMRVINATFSSPQNLNSDVSWTTNNGSIVFTQTVISPYTTIDYDLLLIP